MTWAQSWGQAGCRSTRTAASHRPATRRQRLAHHGGAVGAVPGQGLAGPFTRDQDAPAAETEILDRRDDESFGSREAHRLFAASTGWPQDRPARMPQCRTGGTEPVIDHHVTHYHSLLPNGLLS